MGGRRQGRSRGTSIYVLPAMVDMVLGLALFVGTVRAAQMEGDAVRAASVLAAWSLVYVIACPLVGRRVTSRNARRLVLTGCVLLAATLGLLSVAEGFTFMLILMGCAGLASALFFLSFQIFMKDTDGAGGRALAWSTGFYTFAWSTGTACGPLVSGFLMQTRIATPAGVEVPGWRIAFLFGAAVCLLLSLWLAAAGRGHQAWTVQVGSERGGTKEPSRADTKAPSRADMNAGMYDSMPDRVWLGWLGATAGIAALSVLRSVFPSRAIGALRISEGMLGSIFFVLNMTQALVGLALTKSRFWMYRFLPIAGFAAAGLIGLLFFGFGERPVVFLAGAVLFGTFSGSFWFSLVFHALVHPRRSGRYVAINESLVGLTGLVAPLLGGVMADAWGFRFSGLAAMALVGCATAMQVWISRTPGRAAAAG